MYQGKSATHDSVVSTDVTMEVVGYLLKVLCWFAFRLDCTQFIVIAMMQYMLRMSSIVCKLS